MDYKKIILGCFLLGVLFLAGCNTGSENTGQGTVGYTGVNTRVTYYPDVTYVYLDNYGKVTGENLFDVGVEVENPGSSLAYAGLFLSGYDPHTLEVQFVDNNGINIPGAQVNPRFLGGSPCGFGMSNTGGVFGGILDCSFGFGDVNFGSGPSGWNAGMDFNFNNLLGAVGVNTGDWGGFLSLLGGSVNVGQDGFSFNIGSTGIMARDYIPGASMLPFITALAGYQFGDFSSLGGIPELLKGNTRLYPGGDKAYVNYKFKVKNWNSAADKMTQTMLLTTCYTYSTFASPSVCIDPDPNAVNVDKICDAEAPISLSGGQGAPITITRIVPHPGPRRAYFDIYFKHQGSGHVYQVDSIGMCSPFYSERVSERVIDMVFPAIVSIQGHSGPVPLECTPSGYVKMRDGEGMVSCRYDYSAETGATDSAIMASKNGYYTPLVIELWYGYSESERFEMEFYRG